MICQQSAVPGDQAGVRGRLTPKRSVVVVNHPRHVRAEFRLREVVAPGVSVGLDPAAVQCEDARFAAVLAAHRQQLPKGVVTLVDPVAVFVRLNQTPLGIVQTRLGHDLELLLPGEVVTDVAVVNGGRAMVLGVLDTEDDCHSGPTAAAEHLAALAARQLPRGSLIPPQVEHPQAREVLGHAQPHPLGGVAVQPATVADERDDATLLEPVGGPAVGANVGVVEAVLVGRG